MDIASRLIYVISAKFEVVAIFLLIFLFGAGLLTVWLQWTGERALLSEDYLWLGISGWIVPIFFLAGSFYLLAFFFQSAFIYFFILGGALLCIVWKLKKIINAGLFAITLCLIVIFLLLTGLHLAFIAPLTFPPYFDSAEHYKIISFIQTRPISQWTGLYYHFGYHLVLAEIGKLFNLEIIDEMLVSGQIALATIALAFFFIIKKETSSNPAAFFTVCLAGFGWYQPAYAVNWGKYPALFGLISSLFIFNLSYLWISGILPRSKRLAATLLFSVLCSGLIHTRSLIICGLFCAALYFATICERLSVKGRIIAHGSTLLLLIATFFYLRGDSVFASLFSSYQKEDLFALLGLCILSVFALIKFPKLTIALLLFCEALIWALYINVSGLLNYPNLFLLDRPLAQMLLFIPFSLIAGLGLAGLLEITRHKLRIRKIIQIGAFTLLALDAVFFRKSMPADCCQFAGQEDASAFLWIQQNLSNDATILIASQTYAFTPDASQSSPAGADAGIWVAPITSKKAEFFPSNTDFTQPNIYAQICKLRTAYLYVGNQPYSFNAGSISAKPEWYQNELYFPDVQIYQVSACP